MPNLPTPISTRTLDPYPRRCPPARLHRAVTHAVHLEHGRAIVAATRVQAVHYVASTAARAIEDLTDMEALAISRNPLAEPRLRAINDTATAALAHIVAETGRA